MKFNCPSCGAKYRIADDKIASRSHPRMKCRKCEYIIPIREVADADAGGGDEAAVAGSILPSLAPPGPSGSASTGGPGGSPAELPLPPPVPGGGLTGEDIDTVRLASAVAEAPGTLGQASKHDATSVAGGGGRVPANDADARDATLGQGDEWFSSGEPPPEVPDAPPPPLGNVPPSVPPSTGTSMPPSHGFMELQHAAGLGSKKAVSGLGWLLVALAYGLGLGTGALVFKTAAPVDSGVASSRAVLPSIPPPPADSAEEGLSAPDGGATRAAEGATAATAVGGAVRGGAPRKTTATKPGGSRGQGLLSGLNTAPAEGPSSGKPATPQPGGGGELSSAVIQRTIAANQASVRNGCWQRALNARDLSAPSTARINARLTVAPSGRVSSVSTSGDPPGYPGLASCIERRVSGWTFPSSSSSTTVNVPFVFAAQ